MKKQLIMAMLIVLAGSASAAEKPGLGPSSRCLMICA